MQIQNAVLQHLRENRWQYLLVVFIFLLGAFLGNYKVSGMGGSTKTYLLNLLDNYLYVGAQGDIRNQEILVNAVLNQGKYVMGVWFLGLTVIGLPLILGAVLLRGLSFGFTLGFLIQEKAAGGFMVGLLSIIPQNLIYIPFMLIWSVIAVNFTIDILKGIYFNKTIKIQGLISYTMLMLVFLLFFLLGALIEAYLSPWCLNLFLKNI